MSDHPTMAIDPDAANALALKLMNICQMSGVEPTLAKAAFTIASIIFYKQSGLELIHATSEFEFVWDHVIFKPTLN